MSAVPYQFAGPFLSAGIRRSSFRERKSAFSGDNGSQILPTSPVRGIIPTFMQLALKQRSYVLTDVVSDRYETACRVRFRETIQRVSGRIAYPALDIGEPNALSRALRIFRNTDWDLNAPWPVHVEQCASVTCFEVIEHVQNPLLLLENIRLHMETGGTLFLTTPVAWWIGKGEFHFHEFTRDDLESVLTMSGFAIERLDRMRAYTWDWKYTGIRPVIRLIRDMIWGQCWYLEAVAVERGDTGAGDR